MAGPSCPGSCPGRPRLDRGLRNGGRASHPPPTRPAYDLYPGKYLFTPIKVAFLLEHFRIDAGSPTAHRRDGMAQQVGRLRQQILVNGLVQVEGEGLVIIVRVPDRKA